MIMERNHNLIPHINPDKEHRLISRLALPLEITETTHTAELEDLQVIQEVIAYEENFFQTFYRYELS